MLQGCQLVEEALQPVQSHVSEMALYLPSPCRDPSQTTTLAQGLQGLGLLYRRSELSQQPNGWLYSS